jgi:amino acid transporter
VTAPVAVRAQRGTLPGGVPVPWVAVAVLAVAMSFADGFWIVSLREAAGAAIRTGQPFASWLVDCTVVLPLFVLAVLAAFAIAHRRYGPELRRPVTVVKAALLVALAGTVAALVVGVASAGYDYFLQAGQAEFVAATHGHTGAVSPSDPTCTGSCAVERATLEVHALGLAYSVPLQLATNVVLVGWVVALGGGRLGGHPGREVDAARR